VGQRDLVATGRPRDQGREIVRLRLEDQNLLRLHDSPSIDHYDGFSAIRSVQRPMNRRPEPALRRHDVTSAPPRAGFVTRGAGSDRAWGTAPQPPGVGSRAEAHATVIRAAPASVASLPARGPPRAGGPGDAAAAQP